MLLASRTPRYHNMRNISISGAQEVTQQSAGLAREKLIARESFQSLNAIGENYLPEISVKALTDQKYTTTIPQKAQGHHQRQATSPQPKRVANRTGSPRKVGGSKTQKNKV